MSRFQHCEIVAPVRNECKTFFLNPSSQTCRQKVCINYSLLHVGSKMFHTHKFTSSVYKFLGVNCTHYGVPHYLANYLLNADMEMLKTVDYGNWDTFQ